MSTVKSIKNLYNFIVKMIRKICVPIVKLISNIVLIIILIKYILGIVEHPGHKFLKIKYSIPLLKT